MATGKQVVLTAATATLLVTNATHDDTGRVLVTNTSGALLYVGGSNVSNTVYGYAMAAAEVRSFDLVPRDSLYVYSVAGGTIGVLSSP